MVAVQRAARRLSRPSRVLLLKARRTSRVALLSMALPSATRPDSKCPFVLGASFEAIGALLLQGRSALDPLLVVVPNAATETSLRRVLARRRALLNITIMTAEKAASVWAAKHASAPAKLRLPAGAERIAMQRLLEQAKITDWPASSGFLGALAAALRDLLYAGLTRASLIAVHKGLGAAADKRVEPRLLQLAELWLQARERLGLDDDTAVFQRAVEVLAQAPNGALGRVALVGLYDPTGLQAEFVSSLLARASEPIVCLPDYGFADRFRQRLIDALERAGHAVELRVTSASAMDGATDLAMWRATWLTGAQRSAGSTDRVVSTPARLDGSLRVLGLPGGQVAARLVACEVARLLDHDPSLTPDQIELVSRGTGGVPQAHLVRELVARGVPVRRSERLFGTQNTLGTTDLGSALLALGDLLSAPKVSRARLLDFVSTWPWAQGPVRFGSDLSARVIDVAERNLWERLSLDMGVRTAIDATSSSRDTWRLMVARTKGPEQDAAKALMVWIDRIASLHQATSEKLSLGELGRLLVRLIHDFAEAETQGRDAWCARLLALGQLDALRADASSLGWVLGGLAREALEGEILDPNGVRMGQLAGRRGARARVVFLLDGDAGSFPRARHAAVLLKDNERRALEPWLPTLVHGLDRDREERALFQELLDLADEQLVLVTTRVGIEGRGASPSPFVLETLGFLGGDRERALPSAEAVLGEASLPGLERLAMQRVWQAQDAASAALWVLDRARRARASSADVLGELLQTELGSASKTVHARAAVEHARLLEPGHSAFDGQLDAALQAELRASGLLRGSPERGVSASTLESYATCGMRALLAKVLRLTEYEAPEIGRGILHTERGKRVHDILEGLTNAALALGLVQWELAIWPQLEGLLAESITTVIKRARKAAPQEASALWDAEESRYRGLLFGWLRRVCREPSPWSIHSAEWAFDSARIEMPGAEPLYLKGRVDRVDTHQLDTGGALNVRIVDYKTGKASAKDDKTDGGRNLQLYLYGRAARTQLGAHTSAGVYDYVFAGQERFWSGAADEQAAREIAALLGQAEAGVFWPSPREDGKASQNPCKYCAMVAACGPWREAAMQHVAEIDPVLAALNAAATDESEAEEQA